MFENFSKTIQNLGKFSEHDFNLLIGHLKAVSFPKDHFLLKEGKICQSIYFVNQGSFRQYHITDTGEEIIQNLFVENDWVLDYKSFTSQKPSASIIQATEISDLLELSVYDLHKLMKTSDSFFQVARIFQYAIEQQEYKSLKASPKEKYTDLLSNKPQLIQRFPLKYIASYLAMTPETLSRVR
ncbi:MAG: Crp/Fnr family transcriptional regulator, partial [Bacteroidota bacterium]|nr:Crp/Fnr family transcriptional regulator [Bacteroidota bacterium]